MSSVKCDKNGFAGISVRVKRLKENAVLPVRGSEYAAGYDLCACLEENADSCPRSADCKTLPMWEKLDTIISNYLYSVKISDLMKPESVSDWVI